MLGAPADRMSRAPARITQASSGSQRAIASASSAIRRRRSSARPHIARLHRCLQLLERQLPNLTDGLAERERMLTVTRAFHQKPDDDAPRVDESCDGCLSLR